MRQLRCKKTKAPIVGTSEMVLGIALASGFERDGSAIYTGQTDMDWNTQTTRTRRGKELYMTDDGREVTFAQCEFYDPEDGR